MDDIEKTVIEDVIKHDKEELSELLNDFKEEVNDDFIDTVTKLEELIDIFLVSDEEIPLEKDIFDLRRSLESSNLKKSQQQRLKILLDDIQHNRYRVRSIFTRLKNAQDERDITNIVEQLACQELISTEQYQKLMEDDVAYSLATIANIVKDTKIGQGLKFLPTAVGGLQKKLALLSAEFDAGNTTTRNELVAVLNELRRKNVITEEDYTYINNDISPH